MARRRPTGGRGRGARGRGASGRPPAPTAERIRDALERRGRQPTTPSALAVELGLSRSATPTVRRLLRDLEREGRVERFRGRYRARRPDEPPVGVFDVEAGRSIVTDGTGRRFRVGEDYGARPGDRVAIHPWGPARAPRVDVLHVVDGPRDHWIGILRRRGPLAFATPYRDDGDWQLRVARTDTGGAQDGDVVELVPVRARGGGKRRRRREPDEPWARVTRRLGRPGDPDADTAAIVWRHRLPAAFPPEVEEEARQLADRPVAAEIARRVDLREVPFVTIDPPTARDHDDAVAVESRPGGGHRLRVAIADVSHYAPSGSLVDREAARRGNSVYFPDRALPMLPAALSSDACSLLPDRDRLALVVELAYDAAGSLLERSAFPAVIRSRDRLTYERAAAVMAGEADHPLAGMLRDLDALASRLGKRRRAAGSLGLDLTAASLRLFDDGRVADVVHETQGIAHRAVEEAMLAANQAIARLLLAADAPAVFRNHEPPRPEDVALLARVLARFGLHDPRRELDARALSAALAGTGGDPALTRVLHPIALRAMRQARYGGENRGHFALAFDAYLHFTSPIRRYPDLVVHRVLRQVLSGEPPGLDAERAGRIAARCSFRERLAERAERELVDLGKCFFLARHVGAELDGTVVGVARHGVYVGLDRWPIDGLVHVSRLPEYVSLDEDGLSLVAEGSGRRYALGDRLRVLVASVDPVRARIDFEIRRVLEPSPLFTP